MAYLYTIQLEIPSDQMDELRIGKALERVLGYLKTLLPSQPGYITARAFHSVEFENEVQIVFQSEWEEWEDLENHRDSKLIEDKVIKEFAPHIKVEHLETSIYGEIT